MTIPSPGYLHPDYAESLSQFGRPRALPRRGGHVLERPIPASAHLDAMGSYPLLCATKWSALPEDLRGLGDLVSFVCVVDPFAGCDRADWCSAAKLETQVDAMDQHPEWALCFHRVQVVFDDGRPPIEYPVGPQRSVFTIRDLLDKPIQPCAVVYRPGLVEPLPARLAELGLGDWPMGILHALHGDAGFLDDIMAVYRIHRSGAWSSKSREWQRAQVDRMFDMVRPLVNRGLGSPQLMWERDARSVRFSMDDGLIPRARRYSRACVRARPFRPYSWRLLLWSHLGRLGRGLDPSRAAGSAPVASSS